MIPDTKALQVTKCAYDLNISNRHILNFYMNIQSKLNTVSEVKLRGKYEMLVSFSIL